MKKQTKPAPLFAYALVKKSRPKIQLLEIYDLRDKAEIAVDKETEQLIKVKIVPV